VGAGEENVRKLFLQAEQDQDKKIPGLHVIVFDEFDALGIKRGAQNGNAGQGEGIVTQLLTKIDGVKPLNNILLIAITNRKDMIDPALLRPGRIGIHLEISLPDEEGRLQILNIHTNKLKEKQRLAEDVNLQEYASKTKNYSGAELEELVRKATNLALFNGVDITKDITELCSKEQNMIKMKVTNNDFERAFKSIKPAMGVAQDQLNMWNNTNNDNNNRNVCCNYGSKYSTLIDNCNSIFNQIKSVSHNGNINNGNLYSFLLYGGKSTGKTTLACKLAELSGFPFVRIISATSFISLQETQRVREIHSTFDDAYKSPLSLIILDDLENLIDYIRLGSRFNVNLFQTLKLCLMKKPVLSQLLIIGTSSDEDFLKQLQIGKLFKYAFKVHCLCEVEEIKTVFQQLKVEIEDPENENSIYKMVAQFNLGIGTLRDCIENASLSGKKESYNYLVSFQSIQESLNRLSREDLE